MELAESELSLPTEARPIELRAEFANFQEMAACGTAAVIAPVGKVWFDNDWHTVFQDGESVGPIMSELYELLVGIQRGEKEDKFGWLYNIDL
jgi:branched-chain amino acid aminotransferase